MTRLEILSTSPGQTEQIGQILGGALAAGSVVALDGELGGGKTCFARGVVSAVAPESAGLVASPTFAIMNEYPGRTTVYHFDFYRLSGPGDIIELGFEEFLNGPGVVLAEWAERLGDLLPQESVRILFERVDDERRRIVIEAAGPRYEAVLSRVSGVFRE